MTDIVERLGVLDASLANPQVAVDAQRELERLRSLIVCGFYEDETPTFRQGEPQHELESAVTAEECTGMAAEIERLRAENANLKQSLALEGKAYEETWQRMAKRTDELAAAKALLREAAETAEYAAHQLEKARIWGGMDWHYNPLHPLHYRSAIERLRNMLPRIRATLGDEP